MYRHPRVLILIAVVVLQLALFATPAIAAPWCSPVDDGSVVLGYGTLYGGSTHSGVDLASGAIAPVLAPAGGTVVFAGSVPADGGGTCQAVTIETADGLRISLLPLADVSVARGSAIGAGESIGSLAASGDDSTAQPHLHLSLRRGETYLDPTAYLPTAVAVSAPETPEPVVQPPQQPPASSGGSSAAAAAPSVASAAPSAAQPVAPVAPVPVAEPALAADSAIAPAVAQVPEAPEVSSAADYPRRQPRTLALFGMSPVPVRAGVSLALLVGMASVAVLLVRQRRVACRA